MTATPAGSPVVDLRPAAPPRPWVYLIWGGVILFSGIAIGAAGVMLLRPPPPHPPHMGQHAWDGPRGMDAERGPGGRSDREGPPGRGPATQPSGSDIAERMKRDLGLSDEQKASIEKAYTDSFAALQALRQDMAPRMLAEHEKLRDQLKQTLTAEQFMRWDRHFQEVRDRMMPPPPPAEGPEGRRGPGMRDGRREGPRRHPDGPPGSRGEFDGPMGSPPFRRGPRDLDSPPASRPRPDRGEGPPPHEAW
jgi:hypothetical protein